MREKSNSYLNTASVHRTRQSDNAATNLIVACRAAKVGLHSSHDDSPRHRVAILLRLVCRNH